MTVTTKDISVIIVSYNVADLIGACLQSVLSSVGVIPNIWVVDNASQDGSAALIGQEFPSVCLIANKTNRGFGAANNQALTTCTSKYTVLLNPDTTVKPESLRIMRDYMEAHPNIGLAGPRVVNPDGSRQDSVSVRYPGHRYGASDLGVLPGTIACVLGACQIVRTELLKSLGGFDEDFFLYGEDQDLCLRIRKCGYEIGCIKNAIIMHHGGQSERGTQPEEVVRKKVRAEYLFYKKHYRPETVEKIRRNQNLRAAWRIYSIKLLIPLMKNKGQAQGKLARYMVLREETARG